jgi:hypothetical protein
LAIFEINLVTQSHSEAVQKPPVLLMQGLIDQLQGKVKAYKKQIEEAEEIAAMNLAKYRKVAGALGDAEAVADANEQVGAGLDNDNDKFSASVHLTDVLFRNNSIYTDKKENEIFLIFKEIQMGAVAKGFQNLIYEEMRQYLTIRDEAVSHI